MKNKSTINKILGFGAATLLVVLSAGLIEADAQSSRDPFAQPPYAKPRVVRPSSGSKSPTNPGSKPVTVKKGPQVVAAPPIEARIDYYKRVREQAAMNGQPIPKVTSVLLLDEMSVTGIFKTPRGFAAMVEAKPIKLSYTIYPGEKFFDGQLVAVEENRLVFRKVTKWSNGKFVASVQNMALRKYSMQQDIQGTSPSNEKYGKKPQSAAKEGASSGTIVSPLEEMNNSKEKEEEAESAKKSKKKKAVSKKRRRS